MNILILTKNSSYSKNSQIGGAEISLQLIAEKFASIGENVCYFTQSYGIIPGLSRKAINGVKVYIFIPLRWPLFKKRMFYKLREKFIRWQRRLLLLFVIKRERINIIHTYNEYPTTYDILKLKERYNLNFKLILRSAGIFWTVQIKEHQINKNKIEYVFNNIDAINFISQGQKDLFYQNLKKYHINFPCNHYFINDIGINTLVFSEKWKYKRTPPFKITMVARISYPKRHDIIIKALRLVNNKSIQFHIVGSGETEQIIHLFKKLNLSNQIILHGHLSPLKVKEVLLKSHLFCLATEYEGVPKSMLEAMALGVPVLVSDVLPINTYIVDQNNGFLCTNDPINWADYISKIYEGNYNLEKISENEIHFVKNEFNPDIKIMEYKAEFLKILQTKREQFKRE